MGPALMLAFVLAHLLLTRQMLVKELLLVGAASLAGLTVDNLLAACGAVSYLGAPTVGLSPLWLVAIWAGFGATLRHSQSLFVRSPVHAVLTGLLGGPAAYWGGERLARMEVHGVAGWLAVSATWLLALVLLERLCAALRRP